MEYSESVVVNVPHPARYALHKLIVYGERDGTFASKAGKDLVQAASLLRYFKEGRTWEIKAAYADLMNRGKDWVSRFERGQKVIEKAILKSKLGSCSRNSNQNHHAVGDTVSQLSLP